ncbi:MAG: inorganic diphosphatase [Anaerolineales bacterium]
MTLSRIASTEYAVRNTHAVEIFPSNDGRDQRSKQECVDSYVITHAHLKAGTSVSCEPFGLLEMQEDDEVDHKILAALPGERVEASEALREELCNFIVAIFARFPEVHVHVGRILPREAALAHLERCRAAGTAS